MASILIHMFTFLSVVLVASNAALPSEVYWKSVLPNTPMPRSVRDLLLSPEWIDAKSTYVGVGKGGVNVNTRKGTGGTNVNVGPKGGVGVHTGKPGKRTNVGVGKGGVSVNTGHKGKPVYVGVHPGSNPFLYRYGATKAQLNDNPNVALFFTQDKLHQGTKLNLHFIKTTTQNNFLPREISDSIPFSSTRLPEILNKYSIQPDSSDAELIKKTINECEEKSIQGEEKYCATSLESMVDFSVSKLGKKVKAISTEVQKETGAQLYTISGVKNMVGDKSVVCHKQDYLYAVFYCHKTENVEAYVVSLVGADGTKAKAVAVCHKDTSAWNPKHLAFQVLKVKPGSVPVCHFLPEDHVVWVPY